MGFETAVLSRRAVLASAASCGLCLAGAAAPLGASAEANSNPSETEDIEIVERFVGGKTLVSPRVSLVMPAVFSNGHGVPLTLTVDSPMTEEDHVRHVQVLAPGNPILLVASFRFTPASGRAAVSTRIRLAQSQNVLAVAQMSGGDYLMARHWIEVSINGCPTN